MIDTPAIQVSAVDRGSAMAKLACDAGMNAHDLDVAVASWLAEITPTTSVQTPRRPMSSPDLLLG